MNMQLPSSLFEARPALTEIQTMVALRGDIEAIITKYCGSLPDPCMDALASFSNAVDDLIVETTPTCAADAAAKFRLAADIIEDDEAGMLCIEPDMVESALQSIALIRRAEWKKLRLNGDHPFYSQFA